jgi:hypothetical protein
MNEATFMGRLNVASVPLIIGPIGQLWFFGHLHPGLVRLFIMPAIFLPWIVAFAITFCATMPPFGPRVFQSLLILIMAGYASLTILAEILNHIYAFPPSVGHYPIGVARAFMYVGLLSFLGFGWGIRVLNRSEQEDREKR